MSRPPPIASTPQPHEADIATSLGTRESTVKAHVSRILNTLEVTARVQTALAAGDASLVI
ncbi:hypothetical protein GTY69_16950 [Streptomyces sp. SID8364]|nr:hypothetical protein [Streptomyces sp. SID8364]